MKRLNIVAALLLGSAIASTPLAFGQEKKEEAKKDAPAAGAAEQPRRPRADGAGGLGRGGQNAQERFAKLAEELKLSDEQKTKFQAIQTELAKKQRELRADTSVAQEDRRTKMRAIREEGDKKFKELLSAEQFEKFGKLREQQRGQGQGQPPAAGQGQGQGQRRRRAAQN